MSDAPKAAAGWYPDPTTGQTRYWDGTQWTHQTQYTLPPAKQPVQRGPLPQLGIGALIGALMALIGSFLPWATLTSGFGTISIGGFDAGDGKLTAGAAVAAAVAGYFGLTGRNRSTVRLGIAAAVAGLGISIYEYMNVNDKVRSASSEYAIASVGYGLYACLAGFIICGGCLFTAHRETAATV